MMPKTIHTPQRFTKPTSPLGNVSTFLSGDLLHWLAQLNRGEMSQHLSLRQVDGNRFIFPLPPGPAVLNRR